MELNYVGAGIAALQAILIWTIKESPAVEALNIEQKEEDEYDKPRIKLCQKQYLPGLVFGVFIMLLQQFCGINAIITNLADLMDDSGLKMDGNYQGGIASCAQLIAVFVSALIIDKIGRKVTWIISCVIIAISLLVFALNMKYDWVSYLPIICIFVYMFGYGLGMGPIPWFIIPEYFNDEVRAQATTISVSSNWLFTFATILIWPYMNVGLGMFGSLLLFMGVTIAAILFGALCIHEIKQETHDPTTEEKLKPDVLKEIIP